MIAERCEWSEEIERELSTVITRELDLVRQDVIEGRAALWKFDNQSLLVTRVEREELVIVFVKGAQLRRYARLVFARARLQGLKTVRFHTAEPAVARLCPLPVEEVERVYRGRL